MKRAILVLALFASQMISIPASAIPSGSYTRSCSEVTEKNGNLTAVCYTINGVPKKTRLGKYRRCLNGSIENIDGRLRCTIRYSN